MLTRLLTKTFAAVAIFLGSIVASTASPIALTVDVMPSDFLTADVRFTEDSASNQVGLPFKRAQVVHEIQPFDEQLHGQLISVRIDFSYDDLVVRYFAGALDGTIAGNLNVTETQRFQSNTAGSVVLPTFASTDLTIGPFTSGVDPGLTCVTGRGYCVYLQTATLTADESYFFDESSNFFTAFTDGVIRASLAVDLNLDHQTDASAFIIAANAGTAASAPLPSYPLRITYTYDAPEAVPEPNLLCLLGSGLVVLAFLRRSAAA